jgi:hypothetical protein
LNAYCESLAITLALHSSREKALQVRTSVCGVMLLISFVIAKDIDSIEIGFIQTPRLIRIASLKY